jgi:hypothetical protein
LSPAHRRTSLDAVSPLTVPLSLAFVNEWASRPRGSRLSSQRDRERPESDFSITDRPDSSTTDTSGIVAGINVAVQVESVPEGVRKAY